MRHLAPASGGFLAHTQKCYLGQRMGGNFNPGTEAENQGEGLANSPFDNPLPLQQGSRAIGSLCLRWLLGGLPLDIEPRSIRN